MTRLLAPFCSALGLLTACAAPPPAPPTVVLPGWAALGEAPASAFGTRALSAGDVNGDGYGDLIVGAPKWNGQRGKAYLYLGGPTGLQDKPFWTASGEPNERFADRVGQAGDLNGDGYGDAFVAAPGWRNGLGRCVVFYGSKRGLSLKPGWQVQSDAPGEEFGDCTHPTGDLNGDGYDDLAVGAYGHDRSRGRMQLFLGGPKGLAPAPLWQARGEALHDWFAYGIGAAGDVNGDGFDDLQAGAKYNDQGGHDAGKAYLYLGSPQGPRPAPDWAWKGPRAEGNATVRISTAGDVNGDGYDDLLATAPGTKGDGRYLYLFHGGPKGLPRRPSQRIAAPQKGLEFFGQGACPAGDLDGDGFEDLAIHGRGERGEGLVYVYRGSAKGLSPHPSWLLRGGGGGDRFGWWVGPAGDLDGDGLADLVVGAESTENGSVFVYYGRQFSPLSKTPKALTMRKLKGYLREKRANTSK